MTTTGTAQRPEYDITLSDGSTTLGLLAYDNSGKPDPTRLNSMPLERTAIQTSIGESKYSDRVMPYRDVVQDDWSGGRGIRDYDDDTSRFYDSQNVLCDHKGKLHLSGAVTTSKTFSSGYAKLFEYKRCLYVINIIDNGNSILWRNGDRGAADSNSGQLTKLIDATKTWTADAWIGATVLIIAGPGSEETQPWRLITDNDATSLTVSPAWSVTHTTSTAYVIINSDAWTQVLDLGGNVTDYAVADDFVYFARGEYSSLNVLRYQEYNAAGTWTTRNAAETNMATRIIALRNEQENVTYLYGAMNANSPYGVTVWKQRVPTTWEALYKEIGVLAPTNISWSDRIVTNITNSTLDGATKIAIGSGFTTGVAAVKNLASPVDITPGNAIAMMVKSSVATSAGDLRLYLEDTDDLGRSYYLPQKIAVADAGQNPRIIPIPFVSDGDSTTSEYILPGYYIYIGSTTKFDAIYVDVATANAVTNTMTADYYNGQWTAVTITDGTTSSSKSLAQDGAITFTEPGDWIAVPVNNNLQYWIRLKFSADVTNGTRVNQITVKSGGAYVAASEAKKYASSAYSDLPDTIDSDTGTNDDVTILPTEYIYIASNAKFTDLKIDFATANTTGSLTITYAYYNGTGWTNLTVTDTTKSGSTPWAQDGTVTWTMPSDWQQAIIDGSEALYYIRCFVTGGGLNTTTVNEFSVRSPQGYKDPAGAALVKLAADPSYVYPTYAHDGDSTTYEPIYLGTDHFLYVGASIVFNRLYVDLKTANAASSTLTAQYFNGSLWTSITITDGTNSGGVTMAQDGEITWSPENDWQKLSIDGSELYWIRFAVSAAVGFEAYEMRYSRNNNISLSIPALAANTWTWVVMSVTPNALPIPNEAAIKSVGLYVNADNGAQDVYILDNIHIVYTFTNTTEIRLEQAGKINSFAIYNGDETGGSANVWCFTEDGVLEIQPSNAVVKLPLSELKELSTERTGVAWCTNTVYLWFGLSGLRVEQYYNKNLADIGPDNDDGMPSTRIGDVSALLSYPGRVYASIDAGSAGYSSVLMYRNNGWFDIYTSSTLGNRIYDIKHQEIRGRQYSRLWVAEGLTVKWIFQATDPLNTSGYTYAASGWVQMGRMYNGMYDVNKMYRSIKVFGDLSATKYATVSYKVDDDTSWTLLGTANEDGEVLNFTYPFPTGKRIELLVTLYTSDTSTTPVVEAIVVNNYAFVPVKYTYGLITVLEDRYMLVDLAYNQKKAWGYGSTSATAYTVAETWRDAATPLLMRSRHTLFDNKYVAINSLMPVPLDRPGPEQRTNLERYLVQMSLMDV